MPATQEPELAPAAVAAAGYVPPPDTRARKKLLGLIAGVALVLIAFLVGALVHGSDDAKAGQSKELTANAPAHPAEPRASVTLVPITEGTAPPSQTPITGVPNGMTTASPNDATALTSEQYGVAQQQQPPAQPTGPMVDPRSITGTAYNPMPGAVQAPPRPRPRPAPVAHVAQTQPVPLYQPVPSVHVDREQTARLSLTVGTDGRVHDIDIQNAAPGVMGALIASVQRWRFRPAMEGDQPVTSRFSVEVTFRP